MNPKLRVKNLSLMLNERKHVGVEVIYLSSSGIEILGLDLKQKNSRKCVYLGRVKENPELYFLLKKKNQTYR